jgi:hypothetical protein
MGLEPRRHSNSGLTTPQSAQAGMLKQHWAQPCSWARALLGFLNSGSVEKLAPQEKLGTVPPSSSDGPRPRLGSARLVKVVPAQDTPVAD